MYPHVIHLRQPWKQCPIEGGLRHERSFNCPTGLDAREQVWLVVEDLPQGTSVSCNGQSLGRGPAVDFDITALLALRNFVQIDVPTDERQYETSPPSEVRLEIRLGPAPCEPPE